jgi:hypothetical protein
MRIWVDGDACPAVVKDILFRAAERAQVPLVLVANQALRVPVSAWIRALQVEQGFDVADRHIEAAAQAGDVVVTADIPLAAAVVAKGAHALDPRGELYGPENIRELLDLRNFMDGLRASGVATGGPPAYSPRDRQNFANRLDRLLAQRKA